MYLIYLNESVEIEKNLSEHSRLAESENFNSCVPEKSPAENKAWVISATMGYGHQRAVYPLKELAYKGIITANQAASKNEEKMWDRVLGAYELFSRAKGIPVIGEALFNLLDFLLHIPSYYPIRDLSNTTFQVNLLKSSIKKGLCASMLDIIRTQNLPVITSFYAPAIAADMNSSNTVYSIICDADINRVWVAKEPWQSKIIYLSPCDKAAQRLRAYGIPDERIYITGFPLPAELIGGTEMPVLKKNLGSRLKTIDLSKKFHARYQSNVEQFLGGYYNNAVAKQKLTITYAVGGAGAQKEIGRKIALSLKNKIINNEVKLNLVAGIRPEVRDYFIDTKKMITQSSDQVEVIYSEDMFNYFDKFNLLMHDTDILWTKPSELSFYCGLGLPIIMTPPIGSQEKFNAKWLDEIQAAMPQENPEYTDQWLFELLKKGRLAECAWSGFLKARKLGTYKIFDLIETGIRTKDHSLVLR